LSFKKEKKGDPTKVARLGGAMKEPPSAISHKLSHRARKFQIQWDPDFPALVEAQASRAKATSNHGRAALKNHLAASALDAMKLRQIFAR
jgi:hypothetical protein